MQFRATLLTFEWGELAKRPGRHVSGLLQIESHFYVLVMVKARGVLGSSRDRAAMSLLDDVLTLYMLRRYDGSRLVLRGVHFEWDPGKAAANERKHGIGFETAAEVFFDPFVQVRDATGDHWDHRGAVLGLTTDWHLLCVVYAERGDVLRLISARMATTTERKRYENP